MANLTGTPQSFVGDTSIVDATQIEILGKRGWDASGNEYIYLKGVASTVAGDWVIYDENYATTRLVANSVGPIAIAMAAISATTKFGWYQVFGKNTVARTDTIAADKSLYIDDTVGRVDDLGVVGDLVIGAYSMTADTANVATVYLTYPHVSDDIGGGSSGTVTSVSVVTANGVSGSVATATTTPAITLTLGAIVPTSVAINGGTALTTSNQTGTGSLALATSPTFVTPTLGAATATSINSLTITSSTGTLTITNAKTLSISNTLTLAGTDSTTMTFPSTSATIARTDAAQTFTGVQTMTSPKIITSIDDTNGNKEISMIATGSAVNYVELTNAATGTAGPIIAAQGETNIDLKIAGKGTGGVHVTTGSYGDYTADTDGATITFNLATSNLHSVTLGGNRTLALSNAKAGQIFTIRLLQDGTGSRTVTWFSTITWAGSAAPTLTTTASKADTFVFLAKTSTTFDGYTVGTNIG